MKNNFDDVFHDQDFDPRQMEKLAVWKNQTLIEDAYFDKFQTCVQQRIRMNKEIQPITIPSSKKSSLGRRKRIINSTILGLAALFVLMFFVFRPSPSEKIFTAADAPQATLQAKKNTSKKETIPQKAPAKSHHPIDTNEQKIEKLKTENDNWEIAMQEISDEELEDMIWELDWEENF